MESEGPWWAIFVIAAAVTAVLGAIVVTIVGAIALGVGWVRRRGGPWSDN
ncbi:hypothetical protein [Streptomyces sp. P17]|nr:hypothetical protein [Streptomyces sp. P17]MDT9696897.1 hypothetical protein [Streptomyces sp. P17]